LCQLSRCSEGVNSPLSSLYPGPAGSYSHKNQISLLTWSSNFSCILVILGGVAWKESCFPWEGLLIFWSITPDEPPLNQEIGMNLVSLELWGREVFKRFGGACLQDFSGVRVSQRSLEGL